MNWVECLLLGLDLTNLIGAFAEGNEWKAATFQGGATEEEGAARIISQTSWKTSFTAQKSLVD